MGKGYLPLQHTMSEIKVPLCDSSNLITAHFRSFYFYLNYSSTHYSTYRIDLDEFTNE